MSLVYPTLIFFLSINFFLFVIIFYSKINLFDIFLKELKTVKIFGLHLISNVKALPQKVIFFFTYELWEMISIVFFNTLNSLTTPTRDALNDINYAYPRAQPKPYDVYRSLFKAAARVKILMLLNTFYFFFKNVLISLAIGFLVFLYLMYFFNFTFLKQIALWFVVLNLFFWLISGFNFFLKRYRFGKFTSAIQRFWKRATMCFWLVEGFLFLLFFYYFLNSSQEPVYMYDYSALNQEFLFSAVSGYYSTVILSFIIFAMFILLLNLTYFVFTQFILFLLLLSLSIFFIFFIESYQFYYVLTSFVENSWVYSENFSTWVLDLEAPKLRIKQYYFLLCLIAKYWHFLFIFISWVFFLMKVFEAKKISYNLLAFNLQNFLILYGLNLLCYVQWLKWVGRRFLDAVYYWFFTNPAGYNTFSVSEELILLVKSLLNVDALLEVISSNFPSIFAPSMFNSDTLFAWNNCQNFWLYV